MTSNQDKSILGRNPIASAVLLAVVCGVLGVVLLGTVVGAIVGIPLLALAVIAGVFAIYQYRKRSPDETDTIPEADRRNV